MICPVCASANPRGSGACRTCGAPLTPQGAARTSHALPVGTKLHQAKYTVGRVLGQGGFGITYAGGDAALRRKVAIKEAFFDECVRHGNAVMIPPHARLSVAEFGRSKQRFIEEARTVARFNHPGIVAVYTAFEENNTAYMVMEFLQGRTLAVLLAANGGVLSERKAVRYVTAIGQALKEVHEDGVLHRDVTPENAIVTDDGRTVLVDFGSAREFTAGVSRRMSVFVTPGYAPLEQYAPCARRGVWTDVYALGATLYHLLTGQLPTAAPDRIRGVALTEPSRLNAQVSKNVSRAVMKSMEVRWSDRFQSIGEFLHALTRQQSL